MQTHEGFYQHLKTPTLWPETQSWSSRCQHLGPGQVGKRTCLTTPLLRPTRRVSDTRTGLTRDWTRRQTCSATWCLRTQGAVLFFLPSQKHDPQPRA